MKTIGFDDASIGIMIAAYSLVMLFAETPSGILADIWSRKKVLMLASISLMTSTVIGGFSQNITSYIIMTLFWGVFFAFYSGTYDSIIYDTVLEETGNSSTFEKYFGRIKILDSSALVIGSLVGGYIASNFGLREPYFLTVPSCIISFFALIFFREPNIHESKVGEPLLGHIKQTFSSVFKNKAVLPVTAALILTGTSASILFELNQLWLIALLAPITFYGPTTALIQLTSGIGGFLAGIKYTHSKNFTIHSILIIIGSSLGLIFARNTYIVVLCMALILVLFARNAIAFTKTIHDSLPSKTRAGSVSAINTVSRMLLIPASLGFGYISKNTSVFNASYVLTGLIILMSCFVFYSLKQNTNN